MAKKNKKPVTNDDVRAEETENVSEDKAQTPSSADQMQEAVTAAQKGAQAAADSTKQVFDKVKERSEWSNPVVVVVAAIIVLVVLRVLFASLLTDLFNYVGKLLMAIVTQDAWPIVFAGFIIYYRKEIRDLLNRLGR
ncbi:MMPL family transporter [Fructobacillus durionis]|uniref:MMPL family protein n=1 Tax=Fructobacillus durionis TaxID=283737 RepID=A0A1I1GJR1_9LACO|nr:MMPL family transporter [Fructobacillus durionis]SFC11784.1 MMPL family protein [Fructobacillus durionis]